MATTALTPASSTQTANNPHGVVYVSGLRSDYAVAASPNGDTVTGDQITYQTTALATVQFIDAAEYTDPASVGGLTYGMFEAATGRAGDAASLTFWTSVAANNSPLAAMQGLLSTYESRQLLSGLNNGDYVSRIYQNVLGRPADSSGSGYYTGLLNAGTASRAQVALAIVQSGEGQSDIGSAISGGEIVADATAATVARVYHAALGRLPDRAGLLFWIGQLNSGFGLGAFEAKVLSSDEFNATPPGSNADFVSRLSQNAYGSVDSKAVAYYGQALDAGTATRTGVLTDYAYSAGTDRFVFTATGVGHT